jgi:DNA polymerase III epsilon subunit-like protein
MIFVDLETTGTDPRSHGILSIGAIEYENPDNQFYGECQLAAGLFIDPQSIPVSGFSEESMRDASKPSERELVASFIDWTKSIHDITFGGENPSFDRDFLRSACLRYKFDWPFAYRTIDLHSIGYSYLMREGKDIPTKNRHTDLGLDKMINMLGLPANPLPHNALRDAVLEAESYSRLVKGQGLIPEFDIYPVPPAFKRQ